MKETDKSKIKWEKWLEFKEREKKREKKKQAVRLRDRSLTRFEVINLFEDVLDPDEKEVISTIIKILGTYMVLETNQLFQIYERMTKRKLKLRYIKTGVKYNLIAEYKYDSSVDGEKDLFFYSTKLSGRIFLNNIGFNDNSIPLDADRFLKQRILTLNQFLIENRYLMYNRRHALNHYKGIYEARDNKNKKIICYFPDISTEKETLRFIVNYVNRNKGPEDVLTTPAEVLEIYRFEQVQTDKKYYFGDMTVATPYMYIYEEEAEKEREY